MAKRLLDDWIAAYMEYTKGSESPTSYHLWTALVTLSTACGKNWYNIDVNTGIYNNLFIILIAGQGTTRKSSAMKFGTKLLKGLDFVKISMNQGSEAALIAEFIESYNPKTDVSNYLVWSHELHSLITVSGIDIMNTLMSMYDEPNMFRKRLRSTGEKEIKNPYLNFIGATTPAYVSKAFTEDFRLSGMTSRTFFIYEDSPRFRNPVLPPLDEDLMQKLIHDLVVISELPYTEVRFSEKVYKRHYVPFYEKLPERARSMPYALQQAFVARMDNHIIKVSALLALSRDSTLIEERDMMRAMNILEVVEGSLPIVDQLLGQDKHASLKTAFEEMMINSPRQRQSVSNVMNRFVKEMNMSEVEDMISQYSTARMIKVDGNVIEWIAPDNFRSKKIRSWW